MIKLLLPLLLLQTPIKSEEAEVKDSILGYTAKFHSSYAEIVHKKAFPLIPIVVKYSKQYNTKNHKIDPVLMMLFVRLESSFDPKAIGTSHKEKGLMQCHGVAAKGCDFSTADSQIKCGIKWFAMWLKKCKTIRGAITGYASGQCNPKTEDIKLKVDKRIRKYERAIQWANTK